MTFHEVTIPNFLFSEQAKVVQPGVRAPEARDYVAAFLYAPDTDGLILHKEPKQPYHTLFGGLVEPHDINLLTAMLRESAEELPEGSVLRLDEKGPIATIAYPQTEWSPKQRIHIFTGIIGLVPSRTPSMPAWVMQQATEYMANREVAQTIKEILTTRLPQFTPSSSIGFPPIVTVQYPQPLLARVSALYDHR